MPIRRTSHAVYDTQYHLVWAPKYRNLIIRGDRQDFVKERFEQIAEVHDFELEATDITKDHVYKFLGIPPRYSNAKIDSETWKVFILVYEDCKTQCKCKEW